MVDVPEFSFSIPASKVLNACDECRTRKLKCSGEPTGCARCATDGIPCHYSLRKQMGRPRKRRREVAAHNPELDPWNLGYLDGHETNPPDVESNIDYSMNNVLYTTSNGDTSLPILNPNVPTLALHDAPLYDRSHGPNGYSTTLQLEFPHEVGNNSLTNYPEIAPQNLLQSCSPVRNCAQSHTPNPTPDHADDADMEPQPAHCRCLPQLYTFLGAFQSPPNPLFPLSMVALKKAARFAIEAVRCQDCSKEYTTALQNSMLLGTLISLVINEYRKLLDHIEEKSLSNEKKTMRIGDHSPGNEHLHTGTLDCPMGITLELSGDEWKIIARKTVQKEIFGPGDYCLAQIILEMKDRQQKWHARFDGHLPDHTAIERAEHIKEAESSTCVCVQGIIIDRLRLSLDALGV